MGLGVIEPRGQDHVPGTSYVIDDTQGQPEQESLGLKYDRSGPVPIVLVPQPSDDPNDPLNWPLWKRDAILAILSLVAVICTTMSPILAANTVTVATWFGESFTEVALLTGYHLLGVGVAGFLCVPTARVWGKRHLFILGQILMIISCAWAGASNHNFRSLQAARVFQGFALAPFEALVNTCVGDLYFVHERGKRMALSNVALFGGAFLTPVFVGKITDSLGWEWSFYFVAIFLGAFLPIMIFFVPETAYRRADKLNTDFIGDSQVPTRGSVQGRPSDSDNTVYEPGQVDREAQAVETAQETPYKNEGSNSEPATSAATQPATLWQRIQLFNGRKTDEKFWKLLLRPFPLLFLHPGIVWACLIQGVMIGWTVLIGVVLGVVFLGPPLWFDEVRTGYMYVGAFIGSILGLAISGLLSDWIMKVMVKLNKGVYEPEFRIPLVFFQMLFCGVGLYGFGFVTDDIERYGWFLAEVFFAFVIVGMVLGTVASALYVVDAHRQIAVEAFTAMLMFKNIFSFILCYFAYDWFVARSGTRIPFIIIGSIQIAVCLLSIPMYVFGKINRSFFARHDILKMLGLW